MKIGRILFNVLFSALLFVIVSGCGKAGEDPSGRGNNVKAADKACGIAMDTVFDVTVYGGGPLSSDILEAGNELDSKVLSRFTDSLLASYDGSSDSQAEIFGRNVGLGQIIEKCDKISLDSGGAFDIRLGMLSDLWNIDSAAKDESVFSFPSAESVIAASGDRSVYDLGSVGKGVFLDLAHGMLSDSEASCAVVSAGGSVLTYGEKPDGSHFKVAIKSPFKGSEDIYGLIDLTGTHYISTSGIYERYTEYNGVLYHHILDPETGYPAWTPEDIAAKSKKYEGPFPVSVTVIAGSGLESDALSTACFVLGASEGMELAEKYDAEVIYIFDDGTCIYSDGLKKTDGTAVVFSLRG